MHSALFSIGPLTVRAYGLCMALGFMFGWICASRLCKKTGQDGEWLSSFLSWLMVSAVVGARIAYVIEHWKSEFAGNPAAIIRVDQGGLMFYGGLIGAAITLTLYARLIRKPIFAITDLVLAVVPLGHALGRIGCFFHGCCYGRLTQGAWGVHFPKYSPAWYEQLNATPPLITEQATESLAVIPTQLIEAGANLILFAVLFRLYPKAYRNRGRITGIYLIAYATLRFLIEYLRGDPRYAVGPFSIGQTISIGLILGGLLICFRNRFRPENPTVPQE